MIRPINQRIANTNIFVFNYEPKTQLFTYSRPFTQGEAELLAEETNEVIASMYSKASALVGRIHARNGELSNINTLTGISLNRVLMTKTHNQQWLPTLQEGIQLQGQDMLTPNLIDFGLALYDGQDPDKEIARDLSATAAEEGYIIPILASFKSLDLAKGGYKYGVTPQIVSADGLIFGNEAKELLDRNSFCKGNSGVCRMYHAMDGHWGADWGGGMGFLGGFRMGRFSAVGNAQKLRKEAFCFPAFCFPTKKKSLDSILAKAN